MKRFVIPFMLLFLFGILFPAASFAAGDRSVTILASGAVRGNIDPCEK